MHYDAVPLFCERLLSIEYIDLAEQALQALEKLSHEHPLAILRAGGMLAVLQYVDFFATGVQRIAVSTAANLCRSLPIECAHLVSDAVPQLTGLLGHHDQKVLEHVCLAFARLSDDFAHAPQKLEMLASHGLLEQLLTLIGSMVGGGSDVTLPMATYTMLLRTLATLCRGSPALSHQLLSQHVAFKLREILLTDESLASDTAAVSVSRPHDQLLQIISLCDVLLPPLPKPPSTGKDGAAGAAGGSPAAAGGRVGSTKRRSRRGGEEEEVEQSASAISERERILQEQPELLQEYAAALFSVLLQVHSAAANAAVRYRCLSCISKVVHYSSAPALEERARALLRLVHRVPPHLTGEPAGPHRPTPRRDPLRQAAAHTLTGSYARASSMRSRRFASRGRTRRRSPRPRASLRARAPPPPPPPLARARSARCVPPSRPLEGTPPRGQP